MPPPANAGVGQGVREDLRPLPTHVVMPTSEKKFLRKMGYSVELGPQRHSIPGREGDGAKLLGCEHVTSSMLGGGYRILNPGCDHMLFRHRNVISAVGDTEVGLNGFTAQQKKNALYHTTFGAVSDFTDDYLQRSYDHIVFIDSINSYELTTIYDMYVNSNEFVGDGDPCVIVALEKDYVPAGNGLAHGDDEHVGRDHTWYRPGRRMSRVLHNGEILELKIDVAIVDSWQGKGEDGVKGTRWTLKTIHFENGVISRLPKSRITQQAVMNAARYLTQEGHFNLTFTQDFDLNFNEFDGYATFYIGEREMQLTERMVNAAIKSWITTAELDEVSFQTILRKVVVECEGTAQMSCAMFAVVLGRNIAYDDINVQIRQEVNSSRNLVEAANMNSTPQRVKGIRLEVARIWMAILVWLGRRKHNNRAELYDEGNYYKHLPGTILWPLCYRWGCKFIGFSFFIVATMAIVSTLYQLKGGTFGFLVGNGDFGITGPMVADRVAANPYEFVNGTWVYHDVQASESVLPALICVVSWILLMMMLCTVYGLKLARRLIVEDDFWVYYRNYVRGIAGKFEGKVLSFFPGIDSTFTTEELGRLGIDRKIVYYLWKYFHQKESKLQLRVIAPCQSTTACIIHNNNYHNAHVAVRTRITLPVLKPEEGAIEQMHQLGVRIHIEPLGKDRYRVWPYGRDDRTMDDRLSPTDIFLKTAREYVDQYPAQKRKYLHKILDKYKITGVVPVNQMVYKLFVKSEKECLMHPYEVLEYTRPRAIMAMSDYWKVIFGPRYKALTEALKICWHPKSCVTFSSGFTPKKISAWATYWRDNIQEGCFAVIVLGDDTCAIYKVRGRTVWLCTDFSKFDLTQSVEVGEVEYRWHEKMGFKAYHKYGKSYMDRERTRVLRYGPNKLKIKSMRASGSLGTCLLNSIESGKWITSYFIKNGFNPFNVPTRVAFSPSPASLEAWGKYCGFSVKTIFHREVLAVEFCSGRFYPVGSKLVFGRKPGRILTKIGFMRVKPHQTEESVTSDLRGTMISYLEQGNHVPFLRRYIWEVLDHLEVSDTTFSDEALLRMYPEAGYQIGIARDMHQQQRRDRTLLNAKLHEVDSNTWAAFKSVYGYGKVDEELFAIQIRRTLLKHGLSSMYHSKVVENMAVSDQNFLPSNY